MEGWRERGEWREEKGGSDWKEGRWRREEVLM